MLELPGVTLLAADTLNHQLVLRAIRQSCRRIRFGRMVLLTDALAPREALPDGIERIDIPTLNSREDYSNLMLKGLLPYVSTPHVLIVQWDGYVINPDSWSSRFLEFDYIGARWPWPPPGYRVGNGGFSLRSRRLLLALQHPGIQLREAEDMTICQAFRHSLEVGAGIRFADEATADRFAFETTDPEGPAFGFHGLYNFPQVMDSAELSALVPTLPDAIARSPQCESLLDVCLAMEQWELSRVVAERVLRARPGDPGLLERMHEIERGTTGNR